MGILNKLVERMTGVRRPSLWPQSPMLELKERATGEEKGIGFGTQEQYELTGILRVTFWANRAQYNGARDAAERHFLHVVYGDVIPHISELRHAIYDGDQHLAFTCLEELEKEMGLIR